MRGARRKLRMTQAAFAERLGVAQMTVSRWESGEAPVRAAMRFAINAVTEKIQEERKAAKAKKAATAK